MPRALWLGLALPFALAGGPGAQDYSPPAANLPSAATLQQIAGKRRALAETLAALRRQGVNDAALVDAEVSLHAADLTVKHREFYHEDSTAWTLAVLDRGLLRARLLAAGDTPWLSTVAGQDVARGYRSRVDGSVQPFAVSYPADYGKDPKKRWRVDVELHGRDPALTEVRFLHAHRGDGAVSPGQDFVKLSIFGRGNNAYRWAGETDVFEAIDRFFAGEQALGRGHLPDSGRVVLRGFSMGGAGTWHLGLHWPDRWCVIGPGAGFTTTHGYTKLPDPLPPYQEACLHIYDAADYAMNAFDVPVVAYSGADDPQRKAADNVAAVLAKHGIPMTHLVAPGLKHQFPPEWFSKANALYAKYADRPRDDYPPTVHFVTYTMKYPGCFWVQLLGMEKHYAKASVLAVHADGAFLVKTENVRALRLAMPDPTGQPRTVEIDEQKLQARPVAGSDGQSHLYLERQAGQWVAVLPQRLLAQQSRRPRKVHNLQGPIDDAFADAFVCVRGTGKPWQAAAQQRAEARLARFARDWSKYWRGDLSVKDDVDVTSEDIAGRNLVLFGDPGSNALIAQVLDGLPLEWTRERLRFAGRRVPADEYLPVLIYPNPLNPRRYVVLNTGHTIPTADYTRTNALLFPRLGDYALLRLGSRDEAADEILAAGLFDDSWAVAK